MAVAPNGRFLACFTASGILTVMSTSFTTKVLDFDTNTDSRPLSMGWCGEDAVALHWRHLLLIVGPYGHWLRFSCEPPIPPSRRPCLTSCFLAQLSGHDPRCRARGRLLPRADLRRLPCPSAGSRGDGGGFTLPRGGDTPVSPSLTTFRLPIARARPLPPPPPLSPRPSIASARPMRRRCCMTPRRRSKTETQRCEEPPASTYAPPQRPLVSSDA